MKENSQLARFDQVLRGLTPSIGKGFRKRLEEEEVTKVLSTLIFQMNDVSIDSVVEVRDYNAIKSKGVFKYSGQTDTLLAEGLMPKDVYDGLKDRGLDRHVGPSYLRVKGLLTQSVVRKFFGRQMAFLINDYLRNNPPTKKDDAIVCIPNMTGGVWIGDETRRQLEDQDITNLIWPSTPYARDTRKAIETRSAGDKLNNYIEGFMPKPEDTSVIFCFEELRTSAETTKNATEIYRKFGYNDENDVRIVEACVFDYRHPAGVERMKRLGVDALYLVDGKKFFDVSRELDYISHSEHNTAVDWLTDPWDFTRKVLPYITKKA